MFTKLRTVTEICDSNQTSDDSSQSNLTCRCIQSVKMLINNVYTRQIVEVHVVAHL